MLGRPVRTHDRDLPGFRLRGSEVTRLEGFSDAVFGFALTLLVVSLDVPKTFDDLLDTMRGFPSFAVCFVFLAIIWNAHYKFCRRYALHDGTARFLTCLLLFLVLFYVYPLKFLFSLTVTNSIFGRSAHAVPMTVAQLSDLLTIYGLGFAAVYLAFVFLYLHAYRLRTELELTELERFDTRYQILRFVILVGMGLLAALIARAPSVVRFSGLVYMLLFPIGRISRMIYFRRRAPYVAAIAGE